MKIFPVINDFIHSNARRTAADWDDVANIPDIADSLVLDDKKSDSPSTFDIWQNKLRNEKLNIDKNYHEIVNVYRKQIHF